VRSIFYQVFKNCSQYCPKESELIHNFLKEAYKVRCYEKYQLIDVPFASPEERTQFILDKIALTNQFGY
jgi:hypothetical protein